MLSILRSLLFSSLLFVAGTALAEEPPKPLSQTDMALANMACKNGYNDKDFAAAEPPCKQAAEHGSAMAQRILGQMYLTGYGPLDPEKEAARWMQKAADQGDVEAEFILGTMYLHGVGVTKVKPFAFKWIKKSADDGNAEAQEMTAYMYLTGEGVQKDAARARDYYLLSANQGVASAQYNLGVLYYKGTGGRQSREDAKRWFQKAADQKYEDAVKILARMKKREEGISVMPKFGDLFK